MFLGLIKDHLRLCRDILLQLLLKITTTILVFAEAVDLALEAFQSDVSEARGVWDVVLVMFHVVGRLKTYLH